MKEGCDEKNPEFETYTENETLNSMVPLWRKNKNEITEEEYNRFYQDKFNDYEKPLKVIRSSTEGWLPTTPYCLFRHAHRSIFIPAIAKGTPTLLERVLIMEKCPDLLPDYFSFVKGLVDSQDLR